MNRVLLVLGCVCWCALGIGAERSDAPAAPASLVVNGGFEEGLAGWQPLWTRDENTGQIVPDSQVFRGGAQAVRVEYAGEKDWSLSQSALVDVRPGEIFELSAWVRIEGKGTASLSVVTRDATGEVSHWDFGGHTLRETPGWNEVHSRFIVPADTATIQVRLIGYQAATVWLDDVVLTRQGTLDDLRNRNLPGEVAAENAALRVVCRTADASLAIHDKRTGRDWVQHPGEASFVVLDARNSASGGIDLAILDPVSMRRFSAGIRLEGDEPECVVSVHGEGEMPSRLAWPAAFDTAEGQFLVLPVNEGISYPADDESLPEMYYHLYGGHGLCMPWYGAVEGQTAWMAIIETADDAAVRIPRRDGLLCLVPEWQPQKGAFGPERVIRYVFFDGGGYVAMAKRYRAYAKSTGLFRTLAEKREALPAVDLLVGSVNVWCWDKDAPAMCREMQAAGIDRILWSDARPPEELAALNEMGVLTSRYDIYQDAMNPENFPRLQWIHGGWTSEAWTNDDLLIRADGEWARGWEVETKDGTRLPCGVLCDRQALPYARKRIPAELETHPYRCRFIDTTTASPWHECYHEKHPMTRTDSKYFKMELLRYISEECGLVCGSETGHDAAVPYVHYFEGMLSLGPYRVPDSGRDMMRVWDEAPENVAKFQTGHGYRLPLWELVYHDCVIAQWYWGDYNNKLPGLWDRRDLWNALYGTPPMFMFGRERWEQNKERFVRSYTMTGPVARATGYSEMLSHEWLTADHAVQQTRFANGVTVTVNFGDTAYSMADGTILPPLGRRVEGMDGEEGAA